jgi:antitoxin HicB
MKIRKEIVGSSFDDWLKEEGIYEEVTATAVKRVIAAQIQRMMEKEHVSKAEMAKRMQTSRSALDRLLDPGYDAVTLNTLFKAATAIGRQIRLELV